MELKRLRYFVAVAEELHFGRAARRLGIAQPPLSQQIQRLEGELDVRLFERDRRGVQLTAAGEALLPRALALLADARVAEETVRATAAGALGTLRVGFVGSATFSVLPGLLRSFRSARSGVELKLFELTTARQLDALERAELDVGFVRAHAPRPALASTPIFEEPLVAALPSNHHLSASGAISLDALAGESFVMFPRGEGGGLHEQILILCREAGFEPRVEQEALQMHTIVGLVGAGLGVSIVPASLQCVALPTVKYLPITASHSWIALSLTWRFRDMSPATAAFVEHVGALT